jgi:hypothetical protein
MKYHNIKVHVTMVWINITTVMIVLVINIT